MDHELDDPLEYYRAIVAALARLAAAHQSGALSPEADLSFPFDLTRALAFNPIDADEARLRDRIAGYAEFARLCPQLFPSSITQPGFIAKLERDATRFLRHDAQIRRFLHTDPDMIALCHWNANIDNAWFWRDPAGALHCGLLDWGLVRQMNLAGALWGGLCSADRGLWNDHLETLLALFVRELAAHGGRQIAVEKLGLHLDLSVAMLGLALMMDVSTLVRARVPNIAHARSQRDPMLLGDRVAHGFLHVFTGFLNLWEKRDFGASLDRMLEHDPRS
jgi:hypothetical protein